MIATRPGCHRDWFRGALDPAEGCGRAQRTECVPKQTQDEEG